MPDPIALPGPPHPSGDDRLAVYTVSRSGEDAWMHRLAETSDRGLAACLRTLVEEGQIEEGRRIGIFDRATRRWLVNPFAGTSPHI